MIRHWIKTAKQVFMLSWRTISIFLEQATAQGTRSTILRPLQWMVLVLGLILLGGLKYNAPTWLLIALLVILLIFSSAFLLAYFSCLFSGKPHLVDALRTEHYSIQKLAIETFGPVGQQGKELTPEDLTKLIPVSPKEGKN
jgi:hypothetical protein